MTVGKEEADVGDGLEYLPTCDQGMHKLRGGLNFYLKPRNVSKFFVRIIFHIQNPPTIV